jgi:hypothetical protein
VKKTPSWIKYVILILIGIIIVGAYKGCKNARALGEEKRFSDTLRKLLDESIKIGYENKEKYETAVDVLDGQNDILENRLESKDDSLKSANERITRLLRKHVPIEPNPDTSVTVVPNEYLNDCQECFDELESGQQLVKRYKSIADSLEWLKIKKDILQDQRILQLNAENENLRLTLQDAIKVSKQNEKKYEIRRKLLFSLSTISVRANYPTGLGIGAVYQDKRNMLFGVNAYGTNVGSVYTATLSLPLSFRRIK